MSGQPSSSELLAQLADRVAIQDAMARYARAVDRSDWDGVLAAYHPDAYDDHGEYKGDLAGLIPYLQQLMATSVGGMHMLGNCLIDFATPDAALVETYFISQRLRPAAHEDTECGPNDAICRLGWGRYLDRWERRDGQWKVAHRQVTMDAIFSVIAKGGATRGGRTMWGTRGPGDPLYAMIASMLPSQ